MWGLGYLTLDRQSRTLSGGEVQRINLTTALGTSLVNTLFVLDEPSIGLHPRDMGRVIDVMRRLKAAGNSLVVVEHDPQVMQAADRLIDVGPGPGEKGGEIVFYGAPSELQNAERSLTADYLLGRKQVSEASLPVAKTALSSAALIDQGRATAQPQEHRCCHSVASPGLRDWRVRLGQVDVDSRRAVSGAAKALRQADRSARRT